MCYEEYPHEVTFQKSVEVPDGGGGRVLEWVDYLTVDGFMDTQSSTIGSKEQYQANQQISLPERYLYTYYRTDITSDMRVVFEGETYELVGRPEDQGGQHEIMRIPLKLVSDE